MSKGNSVDEKLAEIQRLLKERDSINERLRMLVEPEKVAVLPVGFSMNSEVLNVVQNGGMGGVSAKDILKILDKKYPTYGIDRKRVASALAYLKNTKKSVTQKARGVYVVVS